jgi:RNA polymerase sigma factor (sigma-70 family)
MSTQTISAARAAGDDEIDRAALGQLNDEQLLARFFQRQEDAAFAAIVARHGPLVYGVCRRVLNDANDADDAFQATFLVLVRKGRSLRDPARLSSWLYGVAQRTAHKARAKAALRAKAERQASAMPTMSDPHDLKLDELRALLDQEIAQLPEKYALPLVLCYLEGKTNAQAAAQLGWPEGSISRRLGRARELLRSRLARRGLGLSIALIAAAFARPGTAAVPTALLASTARAATLAAQGAPLGDVVSPATARLVDEVLAGMSAARRFAIPTIMVIASLLLVVSSAVWQFGAPAQAASLLHFRGITGQPHALSGSAPLASPAILAEQPAAAAGSAACGGAAPSCGSTVPASTTTAAR